MRYGVLRSFGKVFLFRRPEASPGWRSDQGPPGDVSAGGTTSVPDGGDIILPILLQLLHLHTYFYIDALVGLVRDTCGIREDDLGCMFGGEDLERTSRGGVRDGPGG